MEFIMPLQSIQFVTWALGVTIYTVILSSSFIRVTVGARMIQLNWTSNGVKEYTNTPLNAELGDVLELECHDSTSNLFIQTDRVQYDSCNASAGSGVFKFNGICFPGSPIMLTFKENSQDLRNTVNFENNQIYYLTSYSNGSFRRDDQNFTSGGQCESGLKMIIAIGETEFSTSDNRSGGDSSRHDPGPPLPPTQLAVNNTNRKPGAQLQAVRILSAIIVPAIIVILAVILLMIALVCKAHCAKKTGLKRTNTRLSLNATPNPQYETNEISSHTQEKLQSEPLYDEITDDFTKTTAVAMEDVSHYLNQIHSHPKTQL